MPAPTARRVLPPDATELYVAACTVAHRAPGAPSPCPVSVSVLLRYLSDPALVPDVPRSVRDFHAACPQDPRFPWTGPRVAEAAVTLLNAGYFRDATPAEVPAGWPEDAWLVVTTPTSPIGPGLPTRALRALEALVEAPATSEHA